MDTPHPVTVVSRAMCQLHRLPRKQIGPLHGLMASQVTCLSCGRPCPVKYEAFDSITLNLSKPACILVSSHLYMCSGSGGGGRMMMEGDGDDCVNRFSEMLR